MKDTFEETQKFTQTWIWIVLIGTLTYLMYLWNKSGDTNTSLVYTSVILLTLGIIYLFWISRLDTFIDSNEIKIRFVPLVIKDIYWEDVDVANVIDYGFVGGWGIRLGTRYGTVYNIKGSKGLQLVLKSGKRLVVGTQREEELKRVVDHIKKEYEIL